MTLNDRGGGHQRSLGRFLVCLFIWFIILTQCGTYWIYETIDKIVNIDNNSNQEVTRSERSINNEVQKPRSPSGIGKIFSFLCTKVILYYTRMPASRAS